MEPPPSPELEPLGEWGTLIADYRATGMTVAKHPLKLLRPGLAPWLLRSSDLERTDHGAEVEIGGMVTARQRPETANGITFMLLEDERGAVNLVVPPPVYDRHRPLVRTAPLLRARGRLERREGTVNVVVVDPHPDAVIRNGSQFVPRAPAPQAPPAPSAAELQAVAPAGHAFGRRGR